MHKEDNHDVSQTCSCCTKLAIIPKLQPKEKDDQPTKHIIQSVLALHSPIYLALDKSHELMKEGPVSE